MLRRSRLLPALLAAGLLLSLPGVAAAECASPPFVAPTTIDGPGTGGGLPSAARLDLATFSMSVDASCKLSLDVGLTDPAQSAPSSRVSYFIDADDSPLTGSTSVPTGQDWVVARYGKTVLLYRWNVAAQDFLSYPFQGSGTAAIGTWGAAVDLQIFAPAGAHDMTVYALADGPYGIEDVVPDAGVVPFHVEMGTKLVAPVPQIVPQQGAKDPAKAVAKQACTIPKVTRNTLVRAKKLLRKSNCGVVSTVRRSSKKIKRGRAVRTSPPGGSVISPTTKVVLVISSGKPKKKHKR